MNNSSNVVFGNFMWRLMERFGAQIITFVVSVILARLLDPAVYGTVSLVTVLTTLMQLCVDSGLGCALIQKKDADDLDFSSVFYFNVFLSLVLYGILFISAPAFAIFYNIPELKDIVRVLGIMVIVAGVKNIQQAYVSRHMLFRRFFFSTLAGTVSAAVVGIWMAFRGYGVWALVAQYLTNAIMDTSVLWFTVGWRPKLIFSWKRLCSLLAFAWKVLATYIMTEVEANIRQMLIVKIYTQEQLAFFNRGNQFPLLFVNNVSAAVDSVSLPSMSAEQNDVVRVCNMLRRTIKIESYIIMPIMVGLMAVAEPLIRVVLTEKWIGCIPFLRIFCISYIFHPLQLTYMNAIKALGRSDLCLKMDIVKKAVGFLLLACSIPFGIQAIAYSVLIHSLSDHLINVVVTSKLFAYRCVEQFRDFVRNLVPSVIMGVCVYKVMDVGVGDTALLMVQILLGVVAYILLSVGTKNDSFFYLLRLLSDITKRKLKKSED